jgi:thiamine-phosphate pyrophosphorylase
MESRFGAQGGVTPASASRGRRDHERSSARLYLFTPLLDESAGFASGLDAALSAGDIAAVLLRLKQGDERTLINRVKAVAPSVQRRDVALLLDGRPELVARAGADGAHLSGITALQTALPGLKPDRIVGAGGLHSRHDAMLAGEAGADYAMFGEPDSRGSCPPFAAVLERIAWWAELFQPPCIGYAGSAAEIRPLAQAGADFIALGEWIWTGSVGAEAIVRAASAELGAAPG